MSRINDERLSNLPGVVGGLVALEQENAMHTESLGWAARNQAMVSGGLERYTPPLSCFRTVSKRSLSVPTTFLSTHQKTIRGWAGSGVSYFWNLTTAATRGAIAPPAGADTLRFLDANSQADRARVAGLVLIALRAKVVLQFSWGGDDPPQVSIVTRVNSGELVDTVAGFVRDYVGLAIYHTADDLQHTGAVIAGAAPQESEPWVGWTPLRYFDRPDGEFVPVPPLLYPVSNRDPNLQIGVRQAEHGTSVNGNFNNQAIPWVNSAVALGIPNQLTPLAMQLSILVESLFVPSPEDCPQGTWPGVMAPTHKIGLHPDYNPSLPVRLDHVAGKRRRKTPCSGCGCKTEAPPVEEDAVALSILDPWFNVREAVKQMLLLEQHLTEANKICADCIQKHCLTIEAYGEEGVSLDKEQTVAGEICADLARLGRKIDAQYQKDHDRRELANLLRATRKRSTKALRAATKGKK